MRKLFGKRRLLGSYFSTSAERLREIAARRGVHNGEKKRQETRKNKKRTGIILRASSDRDVVALP